MKPRVAVMLALSLALAAGCTRGDGPPPALPPVDPVDEAAAVKSANQFALELYANMADEPGNLIYSPFSISTAMGMAHAGARGNTAEQMARTLHFPAKQDNLHAALAGILGKAQKSDAGGLEVRIANALWLQRGFAVEKPFTDTIKASYGAGPREVDFKGDGESARQAINRWVADETKEKIKDLLQPGDLTPLTRLVLTNAIYFKGNWAARFAKEDTRQLHFFRTSKDSVPVQMMSQCATYPFWENDSLQICAMPYAGKQVSLLVIVPRRADGLPELTKGLTADRIAEWTGKLSEQRINIYFPRFRSMLRQSLKDRLSKMGMPDAFNPDSADFSGITGREKLHISDAIHEAVIEVNEEGSEAAGATAVIMAAKGPGPIVVEPPSFYANRPFLFIIRDNRTGCFLFVGRMSDPTK